MAHQEQIDFCHRVRNMFPLMFKGKDVLEVGSCNVNGTVRDLFLGCRYLGIDVAKGRDVDLVGHVCDVEWDRTFDVVVSLNALEHDIRWKSSLGMMVRLVRPGGLFFFTVPGPGYEGGLPHGTRGRCPGASLTSGLEGEAGDWYRNMTEEDFWSAVPQDMWEKHELTVVGRERQADTMCFWGVPLKDRDPKLTV